MPTTSSSASIESRPRPFGPKSGRSSAIWSGVVCSIKFLTSISLIRLRKLVSDIKEVRDLVASRDAGQLSQQDLIRSATRESALTASVGSKCGIDDSCFSALNLITFAAWCDRLVRIGSRFAARRLGLDSGHRRFRGFYL